MHKALSAWPLAIFLFFISLTNPVFGEGLYLEVIDPYLELHTGPGRGYPKFHVVEQGEKVHVISRRANWYYVDSGRGRAGWVKQEGLGRTMAENSMPAALPDTDHGDYLAQQARVGFSLGTQADVETVHINVGYRVFSWLGAEAEIGQIFHQDYNLDSRGINLLLEPIKSWSFTPFLSTGMGKQNQVQKVVNSVGDSKLHTDYEFVGAGINYYIGFNFVVRGEYRNLKVKAPNQTVSNAVWRVGFSSFF